MHLINIILSNFLQDNEDGESDENDFPDEHELIAMHEKEDLEAEEDDESL